MKKIHFSIVGHFTPRFPDNLSHLIHEYVTVDELKFYRKRRPQEIDDGMFNCYFKSLI